MAKDKEDKEAKGPARIPPVDNDYVAKRIAAQNKRKGK